MLPVPTPIADLPPSPPLESALPDAPLASPVPVRPLVPRRRSVPWNAHAVDRSPTPVPPRLLRRLTPEAAAAHLQPPNSLGALSGALGGYDAGRLTPSPRSATFARGRPPSPLPPPLTQPLPSQIEQMSQRLSLLVGQSNAYVEGLARRLEAIETERQSLGMPASVEQLQIFLETRPEFGGLDVARMAAFSLPLTVWCRVADQVRSEYPDAASNLESVLYWRARAEAEAMGLLHSDRRSSVGSSDSCYPQSLRSISSVMLDSRRGSLAPSHHSDSTGSVPEAHRPSFPANSYLGPRRSSTAASIAEEPAKGPSLPG